VSTAPQDHALDAFIPTRNSLLSRLRDWDDHESWREFFDTYWRFLYSIALRCGLSNDDARDVVQETVVAAAKGLREGRFRRAGEGSFKDWLELIVRRRVTDHLRRAKVRPFAYAAHEADTARTPTVERIPDPAGDVITEVWEEEWARNVADVAMDRVKARVSAKQYQMFDLYAVKGWPVRDVARTLRANVAQVYLAKHRLTAMLRKETLTLRRRMETDGGLAG
jgi:RNA polymerase sigma factor (sigma-70 family)